jgi:hypothetical protein
MGSDGVPQPFGGGKTNARFWGQRLGYMFLVLKLRVRRGGISTRNTHGTHPPLPYLDYRAGSLCSYRHLGAAVLAKGRLAFCVYLYISLVWVKGRHQRGRHTRRRHRRRAAHATTRAACARVTHATQAKRGGHESSRPQKRRAMSPVATERLQQSWMQDLSYDLSPASDASARSEFREEVGLRNARGG